MARVCTVSLFCIAVMTFVRGALAFTPLLAQLGDAQALYSSHTTSIPGSKSFVAPSGFPSKVFPSYYPTPSGQEPQPAMFG